jgi:hypothetical protein
LAYRTIGIYVVLRTVMCSPARASQIAHALKLPRLSEFADCLLRVKEYDEADRALREAKQIVQETDERSHVAELLRLKGLL